MKYFLDFGTHKFEGLLEYTAKLPMNKGWSVKCYEPNKAIYEQALQKLPTIEHTYGSITLENAAVMDYAGMIIMNSHQGAWKDATKQEYMDGYTTGSNTLTENPQVDYGNGVVFNVKNEICTCVDVNEIVATIVEKDKDAEIYIKCDIEGSEFKVLPRLLKSPHLSTIRKMWVDWHERFWYDPNPAKSKYTEKVHEKANLIEAYKQQGISLTEEFLEFNHS